MAEDCLFCKIAKGDLPAERLHDDEQAFAIKDINPAAPFHALVIPKRHVTTILDFQAQDCELIGHMYMIAADLARGAGAAENGYRVVANCNRDGGQSVYHVHFHVLAGRRLGWPPG